MDETFKFEARDIPKGYRIEAYGAEGKGWFVAMKYDVPTGKWYDVGSQPTFHAAICVVMRYAVEDLTTQLGEATRKIGALTKRIQDLEVANLSLASAVQVADAEDEKGTEDDPYRG